MTCVRFLPLLMLAAGCGGKTGESSAPTDSGAPETSPDAPPLGPGWHSYDASIADVLVDWARPEGSPAPAPSAFTTKWKGRIDLHATAVGVIDRAVLAPAFEDATELRLGDSGTLVPFGDAPHGVTFVSDIDTRVSARVLSLVVRGEAITGVASATRADGDTAWSGKATFSITRAADTTAPTWSLPTKGAFGDLPLPWERQELLLEEPVVDLTGAFMSHLHASYATIQTKPRWLGETDARDRPQVRGLWIVTDRWDEAPAWKIDAPALRDFANNVLPATVLAPRVASVPTLESPTLPGTADPKLAHTWGTVVADAKCYDGTTACWHLGPVRAGACSLGTEAGLAVVLSGTANRVAIEVRAIAVPAGGGIGGTPPVTGLVSMQTATPATTAVTEAIAFGEGTKTASAWDSGWTRVERPLPATASSAGIALSLGGVGNFGGDFSGGCGLPPFPPWDVDLYVRVIELVP